MEVSKSIELKGDVNFGQCVLEKKHLFNYDIFPHLKFLSSNERLDFVKFLNKKD